MPRNEEANRAPSVQSSPQGSTPRSPYQGHHQPPAEGLKPHPNPNAGYQQQQGQFPPQYQGPNQGGPSRPYVHLQQHPPRIQGPLLPQHPQPQVQHPPLLQQQVPPTGYPTAVPSHGFHGGHTSHGNYHMHLNQLQNHKYQYVHNYGPQPGPMPGPMPQQYPHHHQQYFPHHQQYQPHRPQMGHPAQQDMLQAQAYFFHQPQSPQHQVAHQPQMGHPAQQQNLPQAQPGIPPHPVFQQPQSPQQQVPQQPPLRIKVSTDVGEQAFNKVVEPGKEFLDIRTFTLAGLTLGVPELGYGVFLSLFQKADRDENGQIGIDEFVYIVPLMLARAAFSRADPNGTNHLDVPRFRAALNSLGFVFDYSQALKYYRDADKDEDYTVGFEEFERILARIAHEDDVDFERMLMYFQDFVSREGNGESVLACVTVEEARAAFDWADLNKQGSLDLPSFARALHRLNLKMDGSHERIFKHFENVDSDENGRIDRDEFLGLIRSVSRSAASEELKTSMKRGIESLD